MKRTEKQNLIMSFYGLYEVGKVTIPEISKKIGTSENYIYQTFKAHQNFLKSISEEQKQIVDHVFPDKLPIDYTVSDWDSMSDLQKQYFDDKR